MVYIMYSVEDDVLIIFSEGGLHLWCCDSISLEKDVFKINLETDERSECVVLTIGDDDSIFYREID